MKKWTISRAAAVLAVVFTLMGGTVFAMSHITTLSSSSSAADYKYTYAKVDKAMSKAGIDADIPETFSNGYAFDKAAVLTVDGSDEDGNRVDSWPELDVHYRNPEKAEIYLSVEDAKNLTDGDAREATETRTIDGIDVSYNLDEYLLLPPSVDESDLDASVQERLDTDPHFFVSYGSDEEEHSYFSNISFTKDGVHYLIYGHDASLSADDLFAMSADIIEMK